MKTHKKTFAQLCAAAGKLTPDSDDDERDQIFIDAAAAQLSAAKVEKLLKIISEKTGTTMLPLRADFKTFRVAIKKDRGSGKMAEAVKRANDAGKVAVFVNVDDHDDVARDAWQAIIEKSTDGNFLFQHGSDLARLDVDALTAGAKVVDLNAPKFRAALAEHIVWYESTGEDYRGVAPPLDVANVMFHAGNRPATLAQLVGVHDTPFFLRDEDASRS